MNGKNAKPDQKTINSTWSNFWTINSKKATSTEEEGAAVNRYFFKPDPYFWLVFRDTPERRRDFFWHRVFLEGYPVFKKYLPDVPGQRILEVGGGSGRHGLKIAHDFPESHVVITDIVDDSLALMARMRERLGIANVEIRKEDAFHLSFPDRSFDVVFCDAVIEYLPNYAEAVKEMARTLKPGGRLIISVVNLLNFPHLWNKRMLGTRYPHGYEKSFTKKELRDLSASAGLRVVGQDGFYFAYGISRLKSYGKIYKVLGYLINCLVHLIDPLIGRVISKYFGFYIVIVAQK